MRIVAETAVGILLTLFIALFITGAAVSIDNAEPAHGFFSEAPVLLFGGFWIALVLWIILVVIGNLVHRNRKPGARVLHNLLSALAATVLTVFVYVVIGATAGGFGMLILGIILVPAIAFLVGAGIAIPLTHLVLFRDRALADSRPASTPAT